MNSLVVHFPFTLPFVFPLTLTVTVAQECEVAAAGVTAVGSRKRLPVDFSSLIQLVLMTVFFSVCVCIVSASLERNRGTVN